MNLNFTPPRIIETEVYARLPEEYRQPCRTEWADANKRGAPIDSFLEGPCLDAAGNLYLVDIPFGRIFRLAPGPQWHLVVQYDGWPNGMKVAPDGHLIVADYRRGLLRVDPASGRVEPLLARRNSESFKGLNDLFLARDGGIYFTDQGQTGLHDPTGRVFRLHRGGQLDCLLANVPSPNGIVLDAQERTLFVAATRANNVWRAPLLDDGSVSKVGAFCTLFGTSGPDGLAMDRDGNLLVAHASLGHVFVYSRHGELTHAIRSCAGSATTNLAIADDGRTVFVTESESGCVLRARLPHAG